MENTRPILYGVADYAEIRKSNAWFVDRTAKVRDLETIRYAAFLRPPRFGKSLLTAILEAYYDVFCADRFEQLFGGTDIGADPTDERGKYLVAKWHLCRSTETGDALSPPARSRVPRRRLRARRRGERAILLGFCMIENVKPKGK